MLVSLSAGVGFGSSPLSSLPAATGSRLSAVSSFDAGVIVRTDVSTWTYASGPGGKMNRRMANCPDPGDHHGPG